MRRLAPRASSAAQGASRLMGFLRVSTALSVAHWAEASDALSIIQVVLPVSPFAACLLQEPVTDAAMHLRQRHAPAVGPRGKKPHGDVPAGSPLAAVATPA